MQQFEHQEQRRLHREIDPSRSALDHFKVLEDGSVNHGANQERNDHEEPGTGKGGSGAPATSSIQPGSSTTQVTDPDKMKEVLAKIVNHLVDEEAKEAGPQKNKDIDFASAARAIGDGTNWLTTI